MKKALSNEVQTALAKKLSLDAADCTVLHSATFGDIEVWNLVTCWIQVAEQENNDLLGHVQSALCDESAEVGTYFRKLGFSF